LIIGIGTDSIEIERILSAVKKESFLNKNFSEDERAYFQKKGSPGSSVAANFAGKEAVVKALGTGFLGFGPAQVEILRDELGKPWARLSGRALSIAEELGVKKLHISITHDTRCALAFAVAEA